MLDAEADALCGAKRYERSPDRLDTRAGHYQRKLHTKAGEVPLKVPKLRTLPFETQIIERYRRRESSVEEALMEMYLAGVSVRGVEDKASWDNFLRYLKDRGLKGVRLVVSDKCLGLVEALGAFYPEAAWQRCIVHFYRNVWTAVPTSKVKEVTAMLRAIHASEDAHAAREKAQFVSEKLRSMKLAKAAQMVEEHIGETLCYMAFPREHWRSLRTNNPMERLIKEVRRRTRVVGAFPDGKSALMLVAARLRYITRHQVGQRRYLDMSRLSEATSEPSAHEQTRQVS